MHVSFNKPAGNEREFLPHNCVIMQAFPIGIREYAARKKRCHGYPEVRTRRVDFVYVIERKFKEEQA